MSSHQLSSGKVMPSDSSPQATSAAASDRYSRDPPAMSGPSGPRLSENALFLHGDPSARSYGVDDFASAFESITDLRALDCLGLFQYNHVWTITFSSENEMESLATPTEIVVKGKRCLVINPNRREVPVPGELIVRQLECFGCVQRVVRDPWRKAGLAHMTATSRVYHIISSSPTSLATVQGCPILIEVAGRPASCLRCYHTGHCRRSFQTPWCRSCRSFSHDRANCTISYAARTKQRASGRPKLEEYMDANDMAAMMSNKEEPVATPLMTTPAVELSRTTKFLSPMTADATSEIDVVPQTQSTLPPPPLFGKRRWSTGRSNNSSVTRDAKKTGFPSLGPRRRRMSRREATGTKMSPGKKAPPARRKATIATPNQRDHNKDGATFGGRQDKKRRHPKHQ
ncbi:hypothetical protein HPB48_021489 [Haemaphysalis longicornis]|uniref:Uncharacterized protein n=1 Tax=Haemaphysalis longicornis TaxID=44386 RepID=A0A9J6GNE5_HAELO|nr:hypothetical protein HPB48_021489 [Haemaphysalis longicornis]